MSVGATDGSAPDAVHRGRRRIRLIAAAGIVGILAAASGIVLARDVLVVRDGLLAARAEVVTLADAAAERDVTAALRATADASTELFPAEQRIATRRWRAVAALPRIGAPFALVSELTTTLRAGLDVVDALADDAVLDGLRPTVIAGTVDLAPLVELAAALDAAPIGRLEASLARVEAADMTFAPAVLRGARDEALDLVGPALTTLTRARDITAGLPTFLGADGPRRYLVVLQTSGELRGTGGLVGVLAVLEADGGRLLLGAPRTFDPLEDQDATRDPVLQGLPAGARPPLEPTYRDRYGHVDPHGSLSNVNVDPDVPTTGEVLLDLYEARTGSRLDGALLLDPIGMQALLEAVDASLELPEVLVAGTSTPRVIPADRFARFALVDLYTDFGQGRGTERDQVVAALAGQALDALLTRSWDGTRMLDAIVRAANGRHLQVHTRDAVAARALAGLPSSGRLADAFARDGVDTFAVTVNNAVGGKQDVHVAHTTDIVVSLGDPSTGEALRGASGPDGATMLLRSVARQVTVRQTITNPLVPGSYDLYITGHCLVGTPESGCFLGPEADHRAWLTFWLGEQDTPVAVRDADGFPPVTLGVFHGVTTVDRHLEVGSASSAWVEVVADGTADVELQPDGTAVYRLAWWRQAKAIGDDLWLRVAAPDGWRIVAADLVGADRRLPSGSGAHGAPTPVPVVTPDGDVAEVLGIVGTDVTLEVRMAPR